MAILKSKIKTDSSNFKVNSVEMGKQIDTLKDLLRKSKIEGTDASIKKAREVGFHAMLLDKVLQKFPPMLHKWFLQHFSEPSTWLEARLKFSM